MKKYRTSLVLEGGGMRGAYTAGALSWLIDNGVEFDNAYGISTGAVHLCNFLLKDKKNLFEISTRYLTDKRVVGLKSFFKCGRLVDYDYLFNDLLLKAVKFDFSALKDVKCNGYIGLYELDKGRTEYTPVQNLCVDELKASTTLPIIGSVVNVNGRHILDGGITEMIPIKQAVEDGCEKHLIITTKPAGFSRKPAKKIVVKIMKAFYPKWQSVGDDYEIRHLNYIDQLDRIVKLEEEGKALYIFPSKTSNVSRLGGSEEELRELYNLGYADMEAQKEQILALFK